MTNDSPPEELNTGKEEPGPDSKGPQKASTSKVLDKNPLRYLPESSELELPQAERNRRRRERFLIGVVASVIAALVLMQPLRGLTKGVGEWNHYYVRAINGEVRLWVNGEEVSGGTDCNPATGYLCLESEGSPIEFKNLRVRELP